MLKLDMEATNKIHQFDGLEFTLESSDIPTQARHILLAVKDQGFIGGGYARQIVYPDAPTPTDIDLFCTSEATNYRILEELGYRRGQKLPHAVNFIPDFTRWPEGKHVQAIDPHQNEYIKMVGLPYDVLASFDFRCNMAAVWYDQHHQQFRALVHRNTYSDNLEKVLIINHCNCPLAMVHRINKYGRKGYRLPISEAAKIFTSFEEMPLEYRSQVRSAVLSGNRGEIYHLTFID